MIDQQKRISLRHVGFGQIAADLAISASDADQGFKSQALDPVYYGMCQVKLVTGNTRSILLCLGCNQQDLVGITTSMARSFTTIISRFFAFSF
jgi:hypothetical protein